ncbi:MAG: protein kinase, partial [Chloroflexi bacterium]|nr:protein kinase [Chloroflexota bacterium]
MSLIGQIVGDYRLTRWLGGGGFGNVYLAEHVRDGQQVAIKVLEVRLTEHDDFRAFINEARMIRLRHPHIVTLLDFGLSREDTPFLVMEYAPQGTLRHRHPKGTRVPLLTVVEYATQVASALQYAHNQHLVH